MTYPKVGQSTFPHDHICFLARLSHPARTPLTALWSEELRDVLVLAVLSTNFDVGDFIGHPSVLTALLAGVDSGEIVLDVLSFDRDAVSLAKT